MATITMSADKVIAQAEKRIAGYLTRRKIEDEKTIAQKMKPYTILKFFKVKSKTREQAIAALNNENTHMFGSWRCYAGGRHMDDLKRLLALAKQGNPVTLNQDDVYVLDF